MSAVLDYLPRGNTLSDEAWQRRHQLLQAILAAHLPGLFLFGVLRGYPLLDVAEVLALPLACLIVGHLLRSRRGAAGFVTLGLVYCSAALVGLSDGAIEAHFHFFIIIGFIALYQDWVPFLLNILFTVLSHGIGSSLVPDLMFSHAAAQDDPWGWSLIHGLSVLAACVGVVLFWKNTEDEQNRSLRLAKQIADNEISQRRFTADLLINLARRNQNLLHRQLDLLNELEDKERDPDALADLFRLDHLATRIRRNAESLLVLSGEESPRTWREPVLLADVVRAAIAEIEDLDRVDDAVDETLAVSGRNVADLTHLIAELLENAVRFSPPGVTVVVRSRPVPTGSGAHVLTVEDWGVGMTTAEMADANEILRSPHEVDLSVSQRLGLHVVSRLAHRYHIDVELTATPGGGVTAVAMLPQAVFDRPARDKVPAAAMAGAGSWAGPGEGPGRPGGYGSDQFGGYTPGGGPGYGSGAGFGSAPAAFGNGVNGTANGTVARPPAAPERPDSPLPARRPGDALSTGRPPRPTTPDRPSVDRLGVDVPGDRVPGDRSLGDRSGLAGPGDRSGLAGPGAPAGVTVPGDRSGLAGPGDRSLGVPGGRPAGAATGDRPGGGPGAPVLGGTPGAGAPPKLPRRGPGETLARTRLAQPFTDPPAAGPPSAAAGSAAPDTPAPPHASGAAQVTGGTGAPLTSGGATRATGVPTRAGRGEGGGIPVGGSVPTFGRVAGPEDDGGWSSWWSRATPPDPDPDPVPPAPVPDPGPGRNGGSPEPTLPEPTLPEPTLPEPRQPADGGPQLRRPPGDGGPQLRRPSAGTGRLPADGGPQLRRRTPQAHLAAGLRRDGDGPANGDEPGLVRDPAAARDALSRFQAAQRAARESVDGPEGGR